MALTFLPMTYFFWCRPQFMVVCTIWPIFWSKFFPKNVSLWKDIFLKSDIWFFLIQKLPTTDQQKNQIYKNNKNTTFATAFFARRRDKSGNYVFPNSLNFPYFHSGGRGMTMMVL